jgi:hypothetical protein
LVEPAEKTVRGGTARTLNGVLFMLKTGWGDPPRIYGLPASYWERFRAWCRVASGADVALAEEPAAYLGQGSLDCNIASLSLTQAHFPLTLLGISGA